MPIVRIAAWLLLAAVLVAFPHMVANHFIMIASLIATTAIITAGLSVLTGMTGQISLAQAAFCALGAYGASLFAQHTGMPAWLTIPLATLCTTAVGWLLGWLTLRVEGHYLALVTLAFAGIVHLGLIHLTDLTGGAIGMPVKPLVIGDYTFRSATSIYYLCVAAAVLVFVGLVNFGRSRWGRALVALRQSEIAAQSLGIDNRRLKTLAFAISAALGAFGGALQALQAKYLDPVQFTVLVGITYLVVLVIGGLRVLPGAIIGSVLFVLVPEFLGGLRTYMGLTFALVLLAVLIVMPNGLGSIPARIRDRLKGRQTT